MNIIMKKGTVAVLSAIIGAAAGSVATIAIPKNAEKEDKVFKFKSYYNMLNQWLILRQEGKKLDTYFIGKGYKTIAIYGMGEIGNRLYEELRDSGVEVKYAIDKNADSVYTELSVFELSDELEPVDAVVVTAIFAFDSILEDLKGQVEGEILSLEDIVYEI